jgi:hypothetical protein
MLEMAFLLIAVVITAQNSANFGARHKLGKDCRNKGSSWAHLAHVRILLPISEFGQHEFDKKNCDNTHSKLSPTCDCPDGCLQKWLPPPVNNSTFLYGANVHKPSVGHSKNMIMVESKEKQQHHKQ